MSPSFSLDATLDSIRSGADAAVNAVDAGAHAINAAANVVKDEVQEEYTGVDSDVRHAEEDGNAERDGYSDAHDELVESAGPGVEMLPPVVVPESFAAMSHEEILTHVDEFGLDAVLKNAQMWTAAHAALYDLVKAMWSTIDPILEHEWTGAAASSAKAAVRQYSDQSHSLLTLFDLVSNKLMESHSGLEQTALMMPPLTSGVSASAIVKGAVTALPGVPGALFGGGVSDIPGRLIGLAVPGMASQMRDEAEEARQEAIAVMNTVYMPVVMQSDLGVPALPPPFDPTAFGDSPTAARGGALGFPVSGSGAGSPLSAPTSSSSAGQFPTSDAAHPGDAPVQGPADTSTAGVQPAQNGAPGGGQPTSAGSSGSPASSFGSGSSPADTHAAGLGPSGYGAAGGATSGSGGITGAGAARGAFGSAGAPGGSGLLEGAAARGAAAGRGIASMGGGGMMGGGGKPGGGQDSEHKTAGYLVTVDNGDELVGNLPLVAPPVIG